MVGGKNERGVLKLRCRPPLGSLNVGISLGKVRILADATLIGAILVDAILVDAILVEAMLVG